MCCRACSNLRRAPCRRQTLKQGFSPYAQTLDELALSLPAKHVLPGALEFVARAMAAPEPLARFAACTVIVCVAEGCAEALRRHMADVLQVTCCASSLLGHTVCCKLTRTHMHAGHGHHPGCQCGPVCRLCAFSLSVCRAALDGRIGTGS